MAPHLNTGQPICAPYSPPYIRDDAMQQKFKEKLSTTLATFDRYKEDVHLDDSSKGMLLVTEKLQYLPPLPVIFT